MPRPQEPPTEQLRAPRPPEPPTEKMRAPAPPERKPAPKASDGKREKRPRSRQVVVLSVVIVLALLAGGLAGAELYARDKAETLLVDVAECVVKDDADVSFGVNPPFLWQHVTGRYTNISVVTAGNRVQDADGMTADVTLENVRLADTADSKGTIGDLKATLTWKSAGIKDTIVQNLPGVGNLVTGVSTNPGDGTIILQAGEGAAVTAKPVVINGDLGLQVLDVTGPIPKDTVQTALDNLTKKLNDNYPLGIHADGVEVTESGVVGTFSSQDASIPREDANPCFAKL